MVSTESIFEFHNPTTGAIHLLCHGCQASGLPAGSAPLAVEPLTPERRAELTPDHLCAYCRVPLIQAGKLRYWLERLGFIFTTTLDRSAWLQVRTVQGRKVVVSVISGADGIHAPLDDEDGEAVLRRVELGVPYLEPALDRALVRLADVTFANLSTAVEQLVIEQEESPHPMLEKFLAGSRS